MANKLTEYLKLEAISIDTTGKRKPSIQLRKAIDNYLKRNDCVIIILDRDGPRAHQHRLQNPNSIINQIKQIVNELPGRVFLVEAVQELEAWLLIDCIGIFCYYASKRAQYREHCRKKVSESRSLKRFVNRYQKDNTEKIVESEIGSKGVKEHLIDFSKKILLVLNSNMPLKNVNREKYSPVRSPEVAEYIEINRETLRRNNSLKKLCNVIARFQ